MEIYNYKQQRIQVHKWLFHTYTEHLWKPVKEELKEEEDERGYTSDGDSKKSDNEGDFGKRYSSISESEADQSDSREGDDLSYPDGKRRKSRSRGKDN
ncbi:MAG: hypothetical protein HQK79_16300 [Desulfobacterales bacterium]|nr:hypothetical protein [Desulfobacterales bacterium]